MSTFVSSLRLRIALFVFVLFCIPILVLGFVSNQRSQSHLLEQSLQLQQAMAERVRLAVEDYLDQRIHDLAVLDSVAILPRLSPAERRQRLERLLGHERAFQELALFDERGLRQWVSRNETNSGVSEYLSNDYRAQAFARGQTLIGRPQFDEKTREPLLALVKPVIDRRSGETPMLLVAAVRMKPVWDLLANLSLPAQTEAYLIDRKRSVIAHRTPSTVLANLNLETDIIDASDEELIVFEKPLDLGDAAASVVVTRSASSALILVTQMRDLMLVITVIAIGVAALLGAVIAKRVSAPVERLSEAAARVAQGDFATPVQIGGPSEIRTLGQAIATMSDRLAKQFRQLSDAEFAARELAQVTLRSIGDAVISTDRKGQVMFMNPIAEDLTGWTATDADGQPLESVFNIINEETKERASNPVDRVIAEGKVQSLANHTVLISKQGQEHAIQDSAAPIFSRDKELLGVVMVFSDVSEQRSLLNQIKFQAKHDSLTSLVNRREFEQRLQNALDSSIESGHRHALFYLDLDHFKIVNDSCGHAAGDELLRQVSNLFLSRLRSRDTLGRIGGDEFVVLMEHCGIEQAVPVAEQLRDAVEELRFSWGESTFSIGVSIGMVEINPESASVNQVLQHADNACYLAKEAGRSRIRIYRDNDDAVTQRRHEMDWVGMLTRALEEDRFELHAQEIKNLDDNAQPQIRHFELLLRMIDDNGELIQPNVFLRAAERFKLMVAIDRWVLDTSMRWIAANSNTGTPVLWGVNLSGQSIGDEQFLQFVQQKFDETGVAGDQLCFEITETAAISNLTRAREFIHAMRERGCKMALDDFGSGLSSFAYLKSLPVDFLKIDGQFVKDVVEDEIDLALVRSINEIGKLMGMDTIAEFVESPGIITLIRGLGVNSAQGFALDFPKPLSDIQLN